MTVCGLVLLWSLAADVAPPNGDAAPLADRPYQGLAVQVHPGRDVLKTNTRLIHEVADLGADTVLLSVNGYQKRVESLAIQFDGPGSPTDAQWLELFAVAHGRDLRIVLMPKVLLSDPQGGAWRGKIAPSSWEAWFAQYSRFILHFARLARRGGVEVYLVGSELVSTEKHTARWRRLISQVRGVYSGRLGYSANWDHYRGIQFWSDLDLIGLTTYYNLNPSEKAEPTVADLRAAWGPIRDEILTWRAEIDRPLLFTEVGWCSQEGCSIAPWNYYHSEKATPAGHREQAANYRAFLDTWAQRPEVGGIIWWEWSGRTGGAADYHYTPKGKPAEKVLRDFFARRQQVHHQEH